MQRIVVAGSPGSGKTYLSRALGRSLGLPVIHLDVLYWRPGWVASDTASFRVRVAEAIAGEGWIIDGSFSGLAMDLTLARADQLIVIERPRWLTVGRVLWRSVFERRGQRADLPAGCPEMFDWSVVKQSWRYNLDRRPKIEAEALKYGAHVPIVRLNDDREIATFVEASSPAT
jgi:adenylate kinase family enzyme